jgi:AAA+ ATPase superfamily predicted ATPase
MALASPSRGCEPAAGLFNREAEKEALLFRLSNEPTGVLVLLGPKNGGKTGEFSA